MTIVYESVFGSHLYGLSTPTSDKDFKGIVVPSKREILLGKTCYHLDKSTGTKHAKNSSTDVDRTFYSLQYFVNLACSGETVALDMLHADKTNYVVTGPIWKFLVDNRHRFYTKSMKSYIGYVRKQAAKYGIKGSRVGDLETIINFLKQHPADTLVGKLTFPTSEFGKWVVYKDNTYYEFAGSKFQDNLKIKYMLETLEKIYSNYGDRSKQAKTNEGIDWKALSHALRAGYQAKDIFKNGSFSYPLAETDFLLKVKTGQLDFITEVEPELDRIVKEVTQLSDLSNFSESVDTEFWDDYVAEQHLNIIIRG